MIAPVYFPRGRKAAQKEPLPLWQWGFIEWFGFLKGAVDARSRSACESGRAGHWFGTKRKNPLRALF